MSGAMEAAQAAIEAAREAHDAEADESAQAPTDEAEPEVEPESSDEPAQSEPEGDWIERMSDDDAQAKAAVQGWKPDGPRNAKEFLRYGEQQDYRKQLKELRGTVDNITRTQKQIFEQQRKELEAERDELLAKLKKDRVEAIAAGDADAILATEDKIDKLNAPDEPDPPDVATEVKAAAESFRSDHADWVGDTEADAVLQMLGNNLANDGTDRSADEFFDALAGAFMKTTVYKAKFAPKATPRQPSVEAGGRRGGSAKSKEPTFANLPKEAQHAYRTQMADYVTEDQYAASYFAENPEG